MQVRTFVALAVCLVLSATSAFAQAGTSEVTGLAEDSDGQPIKGAVVTFTNTTSRSMVYTVKTDKKGRYFIPNLLYYEPGDWEVTVAADGYSPHQIKVESRTANKTLVGEYETGLREGKPHVVRIRAFGEAKVDFVMLTSEQRAEAEQKRTEERMKQLEAEGEAPAAPDPLALASDRVARGDLAGAVEHFEEALEAYPADPERREVFAKVLYNLERYDEAEAQLAKVLELAPDRGGIQLLLGNIRASRGDLEGARQLFETALERSPDDASVYRRLAWIAEQQGDQARAIRANEKVVELEPDDSEAWLALGSLYAETKQPEKSEAAFTRVVELDPENAHTTFFNIGVLIENKPDASEADERRAVEAFRRAAEIKPDYAKAHRHLAYALLRQGDLSGARKELERYLELAPDASDAPEVKAIVTNLPR